jgi:hypothetical protein
MDESRLNKCVVHLRIFSQLRNLQIQTVNQINIVALKIDIGKDPFFEKGKAEGIDEKSRQIVINLLNDTPFDDKKNATLAAVTIDFVQKIRKEIGQ